MTESTTRPPPTLRSRLRDLYFGTDSGALKFQAMMTWLDILVIGFFIAANFIREEAWFIYVDLAIAAFLALDMGAKLYALGSVQRWIKYPTTWVDLVVLATFLVPAFYNFGFLRILRLWSLAHRERTWNVLGGGRWDDTYVEDLTKAIVNLVVFVFLASGFAYAFFGGPGREIVTFIDAVYFTVTSLTTTGYGDITLDSQIGRMFMVALMITGISLFFAVAQKAFASHKRRQHCAHCKLDRHEPDARFCRACGERLPSEPRAGAA